MISTCIPNTINNGSNTTGTMLGEFKYHPIEEKVLQKKTYDEISGAWKETVIYLDESYVQVKNSTGVYNYTYIKHEGQLEEINYTY